MQDYFIVGFGLAGLNIAHQLRRHNKSFLVFDHPYPQQASRVAGGMVNPLILKRFTKVWKAEELLPLAEKTYAQMEDESATSFFDTLPVYRKIKSVREQNDWFQAADKPELSPFMDTPLQQIETPEAPYGYGRVLHTHLLHTEKAIRHAKKMLKKEGRLMEKEVAYDTLKVTSDRVYYKNQAAEKIIFCEGFSMKQNPYFNRLPLLGNKGEYLLLKIPGLHLDGIVKTAMALIPLGGDYFKFGATYNRKFNDPHPEPAARELLINKLEELLDRPYQIVGTEVGIRPSVRDRRPLLGRHPNYKNLLLLNGLGSHGVMLAPMAAKWLLDYDLHQKPLPREVHIDRYFKRKKHHLLKPES